jgi:hypothetical protein
LQGLIGNADKLNQAFDLSAKGFKENTALTEESERAFKSVSNQLQLLANDFNKLIIDLGTKLAPAFTNFIDLVREGVKIVPILADGILRLARTGTVLGAAFLAIRNRSKILETFRLLPRAYYWF